MIKQLKPALILFVLFTLVTGVFYPLAVTGISQIIFTKLANGSLIKLNGELQGSRLIGQNFSDDKYFWGRPSATSGNPYTAFDPVTLTGSSGSNLGPLSRQLVESVQERAKLLRDSDAGNRIPIPIDLVTASASGLDPHISILAANWQIARVARARNMSEAEVNVVVDQLTEARQFGLFGEPRINVLLLNLALDGIE